MRNARSCRKPATIYRYQIIERCQHGCLRRHMQEAVILGMIVVVADQQVEQCHAEKLLACQGWPVGSIQYAGNSSSVKTPTHTAAPFVLELCRKAQCLGKVFLVHTVHLVLDHQSIESGGRKPSCPSTSPAMQSPTLKPACWARAVAKASWRAS